MSDADRHLWQLSAAYERSAESQPSQHRLRTPACLSVPRLVDALEGDLDDEEERHIRSCSFCQRVASMAWRDECPRFESLVWYVAGGFPWHAAVDDHLHGEGCRRCQLVTKSKLLRPAAAAMKAGWLQPARLSDQLDNVAIGFGTLPAQVGVFAPDPWVTSDTHDDEDYVERLSEMGRRLPWPVVDSDLPPVALGSFRIRAEGRGGLVAVLRETDQGNLVVHVESRESANVEKPVSVEVAGDRSHLKTSVTLRSHTGHLEGHHNFGRFTELLPRLGTWCVLVVVPDVDESPSNTEPA